MALLFGLATVLSSLLGGLFALGKQDKLHLILGFSAGAVIGVAFFDLLPESIALSSGRFDVPTVTSFVAVGFLAFMLLSRILFLHPHSAEESCEESKHQGRLGAGSLSIHSFLDGLGIGLAFQVSNSAGVIVAAAVLAHDFSDGINTVGIILKHDGTKNDAFRWLLADAMAPFLGVVSTRYFQLPIASLGMILSLFCGFFLYIGASDLLPESHHRHPKLITSVMTILGATVIFFAVRFAQMR